MPHNNNGFSGHEMRGKTWTLEEARNIDFSNYGEIVKAFEPRGDHSRENKPFAFPGPLARTISQNSAVIRRGFMRSIMLGGDVANALTPGTKKDSTIAPGNLRLNFQFNPEYIERRVSQSVGAVNPLLQNPANLTQAVPGTAQFNFTMLFNREAEVAAQRKHFVRPDGTIEEPLNLDLFATGDFTSESIDSALKDPGKVGVMHDLNIFDKIIGQGIAKELIETITRYTEQQVIYSQIADDKETDADKKKRIVFEEEQKASFSTNLNNNFGNSAFLNPMPVRIVFSDMFMIEGLVVSSAVAFQKFSQDMIPTVCQVNCELLSLYVGFAKRKAFLTDNLTSWAKQQVLDDAAEVAATNTAKLQMGKRIKGLKIIFNSSEKENQQSQDENILDSPAYNEVGMRILRPITTSSFYPGNLSGNNLATFVTVPQWFNAFSGNSYYPGTTMVTQELREQFTNHQEQYSSTWVGKLPISVFIEYNHATAKKIVKTPAGPDVTITGKGPLDATFKIEWFLRDDSTGLKKALYAQEENATWKEENYSNYGIKEIDDTYTLYKKVFYIHPVLVANKESIRNTSKCTFILNLTMTQIVQGVTDAVNLPFRPIEIPFRYDAPLYYDKNAYQASHSSLVKSSIPTVYTQNTNIK